MRPPQSLHRSSSRGAFSLIEVVLALGVVSFSFVGILGMIPVGMSTFHQAIDATVQAQITQQIVTHVEQTNFKDLPSLTGTNYFFDDQGILVEKESDCIYKANLTMDSPTKTTVFPSNGNPSDPSAATPIVVDNLATVKINIFNTKDPGKVLNARVVPTIAADR